MTSRRYQRWIMWLLPLFMLRALVPMGFMWSASTDGLRVTLCSSIAPSGPAQSALLAMEQTNHAAHAHHHESPDHVGTGGTSSGDEEHQDESSESSHQSSVCPFAAAGVSFLDALVLVTFALDANTSVAVPHSIDTLLDHRPIGHHRIRGPPARFS